MLRKWGLASLVLACLATPARADLIFGFSTKVAAVASPSPLGSPGTDPVTLVIGSAGSLTYTPKASASETADAVLGDDINFGQLHFTPGASNSLKSFNEDFQFDVTITDAASGMSGVVSFYGNLAGSLRGGASPSISSSFKWRSTPAGPLSTLPPADQTLLLGSHQYTISLVGATTPSKAADGVLQARVLAVSLVPEPSSIALAGLGMIGTLAISRRRRRGF